MKIPRTAPGDYNGLQLSLKLRRILWLTVVNSFAALSAILVEEPDADDDHRQLLQLSLLVSLLQRQERTELWLREHALQSRYTHNPSILSLPSPLRTDSSDLDRHLTRGSLDPRESAPKTASRSVQPFLHSSPIPKHLETHKHADHATWNICSNRPHLNFMHYEQAMRPNNHELRRRRKVYFHSNDFESHLELLQNGEALSFSAEKTAKDRTPSANS